MCDLQGVKAVDRKDKLVLLLTDPAIHSRYFAIHVVPLVCRSCVCVAHDAPSPFAGIDAAQLPNAFPFPFPLPVCLCMCMCAVWLDSCPSDKGLVVSRFGSTNLGEAGMDAFFKTHKCNDVCRALALSSTFDITARGPLLAPNRRDRGPIIAPVDRAGAGVGAGVGGAGVGAGSGGVGVGGVGGGGIGVGGVGVGGLYAPSAPPATVLSPQRRSTLSESGRWVADRDAFDCQRCTKVCNLPSLDVNVAACRFFS